MPRSVFWTLSNIWDGAFCKNSDNLSTQLSIIGTTSILDVWQGSEHFSAPAGELFLVQLLAHSIKAFLESKAYSKLIKMDVVQVENIQTFGRICSKISTNWCNFSNLAVLYPATWPKIYSIEVFILGTILKVLEQLFPRTTLGRCFWPVHVSITFDNFFTLSTLGITYIRLMLCYFR